MKPTKSLSRLREVRALIDRYRSKPNMEALLHRLAKPEPDAASNDFLGEAEYQATAVDADEVSAEEWSEWDWVVPLNRPVPTHEEQVALAQQIEAGLVSQGVLSGDWQLPNVASPQELELLATRGKQAFEKMIIGNLKLVLYWARRAGGELVSIEDRFQHGCFGLIRAVEKWNWRRGYTFSTYASWHIRQSISRGISNEGYVIRLPVHVQDEVSRRLRRDGEIDLSENNGGRESLTEAMLAALRVMEGVLSYNLVADLLIDVEDRSDATADPSEQILDDLIDRDAVNAAMAQLSPREQEVIMLRVGWDAEPMTLDEIGNILKVTRERIRQIESKAEARLRMMLWSYAVRNLSDRLMFRDLKDAHPAVGEALRRGAPRGRELESIAARYHMSTQELDSAVRAFVRRDRSSRQG